MELRKRVQAAEAAGRASEEAAAAQRERLTAWVDRQERTAARHAKVYQRLRSAHAVDRGMGPAASGCFGSGTNLRNLDGVPAALLLNALGKLC